MSETPGWVSPHEGQGRHGGAAPSGGPQPQWGQQPKWGQQAYGAPPLKPGVIPLRPLGVGEILDGAITALRQNPKLMLGISAIFAAVTQLIAVPVQSLLMGDQPLVPPPTATGAPPAVDAAALVNQFVSMGITVLTTVIAVTVLTGILTVGVSRAVLGERISPGQAWSEAKRRLPALAGVTVAVTLLQLFVVACAAAPAVLLALSGAGAITLVSVGLLALLVAVAVMVYVYVVFALAPVAAVLERQPVGKALSRSRSLVRGSFWRMFGILLLINVLAQLMSLVAFPFLVVAMVVAATLGDGGGIYLYDWIPMTIMGVGSIVAATVAWPFTAVSIVLLYVDQRIRREGLDIELARAATAGAPAAGSAPL